MYPYTMAPPLLAWFQPNFQEMLVINEKVLNSIQSRLFHYLLSQMKLLCQ